MDQSIQLSGIGVRRRMISSSYTKTHPRSIAIWGERSGDFLTHKQYGFGLPELLLQVATATRETQHAPALSGHHSCKSKAARCGYSLARTVRKSAFLGVEGDREVWPFPRCSFRARSSSFA